MKRISPFQPPPLGCPFLRRARLLARVEEGVGQPLLFVEAGPGYGKTSLMADFARAGNRKVAWCGLARRDRRLPFFLHRLTEAIRLPFPSFAADWALTGAYQGGPGSAPFDLLAGELSRLPEPLLLVIDDFHLVEGLRPICEAIECILNHPLPDVHRVLLSRHTIPAFMAGWASKLSQQDLAFTPEEAEQLFILIGGAPPAQDVFDQIMEDTKGWPHGLVAMAQGLTCGQDGATGIYRYLEREVFSRAPKPARELLVKTSFLPAVDATLADDLLQRGDSAALLEEMVRRHGLVQAEGSPPRYRCHPLFRRFLAARLAETGVEAQRLQRQAAELLAQRAEVEAAFRVYLAAGEGGRAGQLLAQRAYKMIRSGQGPLVMQLLEALSCQEVASNPALLLTKSKLAEVQGDYGAATDWAQQALAAAQGSGDEAARGHALTTLGVIHRLQGNFQEARPLLEEGLALVPERQAAWYSLNLAAIYLAACQYGSVEFICRPMAEDPATYDDETAEGEALHVLGLTYFFYAGKPALGLEMLLRALAAKEKGGLRQSASLTMALLGLCYLVQGDFQQALAWAERALAWARSSRYLRVQGLAQGVAAWALVELDRPAVAEGLLREAASTLSEKADYWFILGVLPGLALQRELAGDYQGALGAHQEGLAAARALGTCFHIAWCLLFQVAFHHRWGETQRAEGLLVEAEALVKACGNALAEASIHFRQALVYRTRGDLPRAEEHLGRALELARQHGYRFFVGARPWEVSSLLSWAAQQGEELASRAREFLAAGEARPGPLTIRAMGTFEVRRGLEPVAKSQWRRPAVERLFKYLVVHRGRWLTREHIIDALWPHLPQEAAPNNLRYALSTLRRVLEPSLPKASPSRLIQTQKGMLRLSLPQGCSLDLAEVEERAARARAASKEEERVACWEEVVRLYRGDLLEEELYQDWAALPREVLRETYLEALFHLASHYQAQGHYRRSIGLWQKVLAVDPLREEAHRGLMACYAAAGQRGAALHQYALLKDLLAKELGADPEPETQALYRRLLAGQPL